MLRRWVVLFVLLLTGCQSIGIPQIQPPRYGTITYETIGWYRETGGWVGLPLFNGLFVRVVGPCREMMNEPKSYCPAELVDFPDRPQLWVTEAKLLFAHEPGITLADEGYNIADFLVDMTSLSAEEAMSLVKSGYQVPNGESRIGAGDCIAIGASAEKITVPEGFYRNFLFPDLTLICAPRITDSSQDERYTYSVAGEPNGSHDELYFSAQ